MFTCRMVPLATSRIILLASSLIMYWVMGTPLSSGSVHPSSKEVAVLSSRKGGSGLLGVPIYR